MFSPFSHSFRLLRPKGVSGRVILLLACALGAASCGGSSGPSAAPTSVPAPTPAPAPTPVPAPAGPATVLLTPNGATPHEVTIPVGSTVTFVNNNVFNHDVSGGPDPEHRDCPEIDNVGFLTPGQSRATLPFRTARVCEYHDHTFHTPLFNGRIVIQ